MLVIIQGLRGCMYGLQVRRPSNKAVGCTCCIVSHENCQQGLLVDTAEDGGSAGRVCVLYRRQSRLRTGIFADNVQNTRAASRTGRSVRSARVPGGCGRVVQIDSAWTCVRCICRLIGPPDELSSCVPEDPVQRSALTVHFDSTGPKRSLG